jgi:tetratricopeptide (TPR) repeat protein
MRVRPAILASALLVILTCSSSVCAQNVHTLQGRVIAPNGLQPQNPVRVTLTFDGRRIYETFTDLSGRFSFTGLGRGTYQLTADGDDQIFDKTTVYAEVSAFGSAPQLFTQDIQLQPLRGKPIARAAVVNAFTQNAPKTATQALERGQKLDQEGKHPEALAQIQEALRIFPTYFEAHLALGNHFLKDGRFNDAIAELDRAREINPNDERLYESFGLIMLQQRNYQVAAAVFAEATRLNPTNPLNPLMLGTTFIHQASGLAAAGSSADDTKPLLAKAEGALARAAELSGGKMKADHLTLGMLYELKGEPGRAADELEEYLRKSPTATNAAQIREHVKTLRGGTNRQKAPAP